jgi:hypothetical protein
MAIALHYQVFSAKPLYDVFRAVVIAIIDDTMAEEGTADHDLDPPPVGSV